MKQKQNMNLKENNFITGIIINISWRLEQISQEKF